MTGYSCPYCEGKGYNIRYFWSGEKNKPFKIWCDECMGTGILATQDEFDNLKYTTKEDLLCQE